MSGLGSVTPQAGLRLSFKLQTATARTAVYECTFRWTDSDSDATPADVCTLAHVNADGPEVRFDDAQAVPAWALAFARTLLRTMARGVEGARWPRRLTRWRETSPARRG